MVLLETVFLKNVILYINSFHTLSEFLRINKKCFEAVQTMFTNSFPLITEDASDEILTRVKLYFPSIQTIRLPCFSLFFLPTIFPAILNIEVLYDVQSTLDQCTSKKFIFPRVINFKGSVEHITCIMKKVQKLILPSGNINELTHVLKNIRLFPRLSQIVFSIDYDSELDDFQKLVIQFQELKVDILVNHVNFDDLQTVKLVQSNLNYNVKHFYYSFSPFTKMPVIFVLLPGLSFQSFDETKVPLNENTTLMQLYYPMNYEGTVLDFSRCTSLTNIVFTDNIKNIKKLCISKSLKRLEIQDFETQPEMSDLSTAKLEYFEVGTLQKSVALPTTLTELHISNLKTFLICPENLLTLRVLKCSREVRYNKKLVHLTIPKLCSNNIIPSSLKELDTSQACFIDKCVNITALTVSLPAGALRGYAIESIGLRPQVLSKLPSKLKELTITDCDKIDAIETPSNITKISVFMNVGGYHPLEIFTKLKLSQFFKEVEIALLFQQIQNCTRSNQNSYEQNARSVCSSQTQTTVSLINLNTADVKKDFYEVMRLM
ncbi:hypothetical protein EIN_198100 [Entamoeba invadens IP1]|uniref:Uncharacterized protein n=1 Tax=Entamoeba invadens IP1 TaxID=370355 RepID=A0A0A1TUR0_ENTIV|nr:hypothetical protein EIN_198100 [Entamoeba invadens IP1]ELP83857.1 hypothetical protein EIN_198100 [Entamoeba invadens IP1]|eukprot:XP_004183203.1 hypothetical protein EIN_198100 [Entamoeba invadens IP1]